MESENERIGVIESLYSNLQNLSDEEFGKRLSSMMDEQPHLLGFIFNLDEEFGEQLHQELLKAAIVIRDVFVTAGMPLNMVVGSDIESIVEEEVGRFAGISEGGEITRESMAEDMSSPELLSTILKRVNPPETDVHNTGLIISVIIRLLEEAAGTENKKEDNDGQK